MRLPSLSTQQTDGLNMGLMLLSLGIAFALPFELFLFSYAVLGPLHYLTEISWLHRKNYFIPGKKDGLWFAVLATVFGALLVLGSFGEEWLGKRQFRELGFWGANLIFMAFASAFILAMLRKPLHRFIGFGLMLAVGLSYNMEMPITTVNGPDGTELARTKIGKQDQWVFLDNARIVDEQRPEGQTMDLQFKVKREGSEIVAIDMHRAAPELSVPAHAAVADIQNQTIAFGEGKGLRFGSAQGGSALFFAFFLPTLIHVFLFTALFMLFGALKSGSGLGLWSVGLLFACAALPFFWDPGITGYAVSETVRQSYDVSFFELNRQIIALLEAGPVHGNDLAVATVYSSSFGIALTRFIAFAYTYHYLNWFSKTSIIQWHKMPWANLAVVLALWVGSVYLYWTSYEIGLQALFFLSFMHVFMEFPLNFVSMKGIASSLGKRFRPVAG